METNVPLFLSEGFLIKHFSTSKEGLTHVVTRLFNFLSLPHSRAAPQALSIQV